MQKSQEGRKKLEEKLESISKDRGQFFLNTSVASSEQMSTPQGGSLLATRGGFSNMQNKDKIREQMLASINKIKSFRETGEIDVQS